MRSCLLHTETREALGRAMSPGVSESSELHEAVWGAIKHCVRNQKLSKQEKQRLLDSVIGYSRRMLNSDLPWEVRLCDGSGLGIYAKYECELSLSEIQKWLSKAGVIEVSLTQAAKLAAAGNTCLFKSNGKYGVVIGPVALLNKPQCRQHPHLLLCNLPAISSLQSFKKKRKSDLQREQDAQDARECEREQEQCKEDAESKGDAQCNGNAQCEKQQQQEQHKQSLRSTRRSGLPSLTCAEIAAAAEQSRDDLRRTAHKRKLTVANSTLLPHERLPLQCSLKLHSSHKSSSIKLFANQQLLLGYGRDYASYN